MSDSPLKQTGAGALTGEKDISAVSADLSGYVWLQDTEKSTVRIGRNYSTILSGRLYHSRRLVFQTLSTCHSFDKNS